MDNSKACPSCKQIKNLSCFGKDKHTKSGYRVYCKACNQQKAKQYAKKNPDKIIERNLNYQKNNRDVINARSRRWKAKNKDKVAGYHKKYNETYPNKRPELTRRRRFRLKNVMQFTISSKELDKILKSKCFYCGSNEKITLDHVVPISRGGKHSIGNLLPACLSCNSRKQSKTITEWKHAIRCNQEINRKKR